MAQRGKSRRQLSFPPVADETRQQDIPCTLCLNHHPHMSQPRTWKSQQAQLIALSLQIELDKPICRPCRDDISRLLKDQNHQPRWKKQAKIQCCIPECNKEVFVHSKIASHEQIQSIAHTIGCAALSNMLIPVPTPLCKRHYHLIYNAIQPTQTHCYTCGSSLRTTAARLCPDPKRITHYLAEKTGFEGEIPEGGKVCFTCYRSQLQMLKEERVVSTDTDLIQLISTLKLSVPPVESLGSVNDAINRAMAQTSLHVAVTILHQEALLLPAVHELLLREVTESLKAANLEVVGDKKEFVTARWVLSNLVTALQHHLSCACRVRKYGILLYRTNGDIITSLTISLHKLSSANTQLQEPTSTCNIPKPSKPTLSKPDQDMVMDNLNTHMHQQIHQFLKADSASPFRFDTLDIDNIISELDPTLWSSLTSLTRSVSE